MAYAAVVLLMRDLEELLHSQAHPIGLKKEQIESLYKEVSLLQVSLKDSPEKMYDHDVKNLEKRISDAAYRAADFIDSHVYISYIRNADIQERKIEYSRISLIAHQNFSQFIKEIKSIKLEALRFFDKQIRDTEVLPHENPSDQDLSPSSLNAEDRLVGIDNDIKALLHRLIGFPSHLKVIPIIGMGGIERCQGLPLAIVVVAGLLNNVSRTLDCWKRIAETVVSLVAEKPQHCTDILALRPVSCSKEVYAGMPRLRKLEIYATETDFGTEWISECLSNLVCLNDLETLKCNFLYRPRKHRLSAQNVFPSNLKKLTLSGSYLPWEDMKSLGMLPNLEVLKLRSFAFDGDKWSPVEGGFLRLKLLLMENSDPNDWDADESHFPRLQRLVLKECTRLGEIPEGIGEILTLQLIEIHDCSLSVVMSARKIQEQQEMMGNDQLSVQISWGGYHSQSDLPVDLHFLRNQ
ncbi:unnamed protein product [Fraxinus pennsylvanica]|uniref:Disease resistance N-terminal domain-containing protein n=1 Tax=Fraxinus pennsylvanica TaxID=56036 RepID=A0AAD1ZU22_9LAMI|nr:unnamed protein product [Fraxinus pennsylvanica]